MYLAKHFIFSPDFLKQFPFYDWGVISFANQKLYTHPDLEVRVSRNDDTLLIALGTLIDPRNPNLGNQGILDVISISSKTFEEFELNIYPLAGRWIIFADIAGEARVYPDAGGLKQIYYITDSHGKLYAGSTPATLAAAKLTERDNTFARSFENYPNSGSWPVHVIPFSGVRQNLPNHYLDISKADSIRFGPMSPVISYDDEYISSRMLTILTNTIRATIARKNITMSLSGGYDSRVLLGAAKPFWPQIQFYTTVRSDSRSHDITIPKKLATMFKLRHQYVYSKGMSKEELEVNDTLNKTLLENVGWMFYDNVLEATRKNNDIIGNSIQMPGIISEIHRCFYYKDGLHPNHVDAETIAQKAGFYSPEARKGIGKWLSEIKQSGNFALLDLFYWEHRVGVWAATSLTLREPCVDVIPPMNSREYIELGLLANVRHRRHPHYLLRNIMEEADSRLLELPFNWDYVDRFEHFWRSMPFIWRIGRKRRKG